MYAHPECPARLADPLQCGSRSAGAALQDPVAKALAMPSQQSDELSRLFDQSMNISNPTPPPDPVSFSPPPAQAPDAVTYTSTHYTHSSHVIPTATPGPSAPSPRPQLSDQEMYDMLVQHGIDPHALLPNQVSLFRGAGPEQRLRLLELWRISPPNQGASYDLYKLQQSWPETSVEREEEMARLRHERARDQADWLAPRPQPASDLDPAEAGAGLEVQADRMPARPASAPGQRTSTGAEPYMLSGYEMLARRDYEAQQQYAPLGESKRYNQATDPAFIGNGWGEGQENVGAKGMQLGQDDEMMM
jgi:hypothetical protein